MQFSVQQVAGAHLPPVSFTLTSGDILTVRGASGVGKSQLLRALADLSEHTGEITLDDVAQSATPPDEWRRQVAYVPAESGWWADGVSAHFTVLPPADWLQRLSLSPEMLNATVERLSTGERQRLALLRALMMQPKVLLLDEPTANLDEANTHAMATLVADYVQSQGAAAVWVTHDATARDQLGSHVLQMTAEGALFS
ncbi:MAG: ATP-binding cassette domain-containing protein [Halothiobacillus sp.]|jgi:putative ABC transport system ATP-binding protein|nr:ATP-binding cassette domain-containing protein [Halothiobacillus sp.]